MVVARGCREGCNGYGFSLGRQEKFWRWMVVVVVVHNVNVLNTPELYT